MTSATASYTALRRIRRERGYSTRHLGALLGCAGETVRRWDHGLYTPNRRYWAHLEAILGAPVAALMAPDPQTETAPPEGDAALEESYPRPAKTERQLHAQL